MKPLWQRALEARRKEQAFLKSRKGVGRGRARIYPKAKIGDRFGTREVIALLPPIQSNEAVRVICPKGHEATALVYNLRKHPGCGRCQRSAARGSRLGKWQSVEPTTDGVRMVPR